MARSLRQPVTMMRSVCHYWTAHHLFYSAVRRNSLVLTLNCSSGTLGEGEKAKHLLVHVQRRIKKASKLLVAFGARMVLQK